jgi:hypothetical protein
MASIVVAGDTSGTVTLAAPAVSGTTTLTLPTTSGTIVTTSGSQTIEFADGSASTPSITNSGDTNTGMFFPAADTIAFAEGGTEAMRLDSSGNVGIGQTTDSTARTVSNPSGTSQVAFMAGGTFSGSASYPSFGWAGQVPTNGGRGAGMFLPSDGTIAFSTTATERMRIDSSGNVQIGKTSNSTLSAGINLGSLPNFIASTASPSDGPYMQISNIAASVANGFRYISFRVGSSGNEAGSISTNGSSTVSYVTSSDYRLKDNIVPMTGALDKVLQLKPCTYTWKSDNSNGQGFIAHELAEIVPDCVTGKKDAVDEEGKIKPQGVDTSFLVATLTAAIQEQQTIIETLKADIAELKAKDN